MKKINLKLWHDFISARGMFFGVILVIFLGVSFYGAAYMAFQNLKSSYDYSYQALRFADFTMQVKDAPTGVLPKLQSIDGATGVTARLNIDLPLFIPQVSETAVLARVISQPAPSHPAVNDVKVESGNYFNNGQDPSLLVEKSFAEYHKLAPGANLDLIINGQPVSFTIAGIVSSPEYIFAAKSRQELLVSPEVFGVVFAPEQVLQQVTGISTFNEFCFTASEGFDRQAVINAAEEVIGPSNVQMVVTREEQASNAALSLDLQEFGELAEIFPLLFLIIGGLATYILLSRMVQNQRGQIGTMRALGYSRGRVMFHYLGFALIIGVIGAAAGTAAGYFLSGIVTRLYITILGLPFTITKIHWLAAEEGFFIGIIPCLIAGFLPARAASRLSPAEAMRTPPPVKGGKSLLERLLPSASKLPFLWKMPLRNTFRNRSRSLSIIIGIAFGISLVLVSLSFIDSVDSLLDLQFRQIQRYDAQLNFAGPQPASLASSVGTWDGVNEARPVMQMPVRLQRDGTAYNTILIGLEPGNDLYGLFSPAGKRVNVSEGKILLAESVKSQLDVKTGDIMTVSSLSGRSDLIVAGFVKQPMGGLAYASLEDTWKVTGTRDTLNGIMVSTSSLGPDLRKQAAEKLPEASAELTAETEQVVSRLFDLIKTIMWTMLVFGAALALAILFTLVTLSIIERRREVASMRTIGETRGRITGMLTIEDIWLGILGLIPGLLLGYGLAVYLFSLFQTDIISFSLVIHADTYALVAGLIILIVLIAQIPGILNISRLDLARVIKEQVS